MNKSLIVQHIDIRDPEDRIIHPTDFCGKREKMLEDDRGFVSRQRSPFLSARPAGGFILGSSGSRNLEETLSASSTELLGRNRV